MLEPDGRLLDPSEAFHAAAGWMPVYVVEVDGPVADDVLERAWTQALAQHRLLGMRLVIDDSDRFRIEPSVPASCLLR